MHNLIENLIQDLNSKPIEEALKNVDTKALARVDKQLGKVIAITRVNLSYIRTRARYHQVKAHGHTS